VESAPVEADTFTASINKRKGFIGAVFGIILFGAICYGIVHLLPGISALSNLKTTAVEKILTATVNELNKQCPVMVDQYTRLDKVEVLPGTVMQYDYTLVTLAKTEVNADTIRKIMEPKIIDNVKTSPQMKPYRDLKATLIYDYRDKNGESLLRISVSPEMYE
jgi:hypothetical protein